MLGQEVGPTVLGWPGFPRSSYSLSLTPLLGILPLFGAGFSEVGFGSPFLLGAEFQALLL